MALAESGVLATEPGAQPGLLEPGQGVGVLNPTTAPPQAQGKTLPYIAHVLDTNYNFIQLLRPLLNRPRLIETLNSVGHPITLEVQSASNAPVPTGPPVTQTWSGLLGGEGSEPGFLEPGAGLPGTLPPYGLAPRLSAGQIIRLTEDGGDGTILFTGVIEDVTEDVTNAGQVTHTIELQPIGVELGDTEVNIGYATPTDVAQMIRDAVRQTNHCVVTPMSVPDTGHLAINFFNHTSATAVLDFAKQVAGPYWWWGVDATGTVWFREFVAANASTYTVKQGADFTARKFTSPVGKLKNRVLAVGGFPQFANVPITAQFDDTTSQKLYGVRMLQPPLSYPTVTDQATLDAIAETVGVTLNRRITNVTLELTNFPTRLQLGQQAPTLRYWEPASLPMVESYTGSGGYSANYLILEVQNDGPVQTVIVGDVPTTIQDLQYQIAEIVQRASVNSILYPPTSFQSIGVSASPSPTAPGQVVLNNVQSPASGFPDPTTTKGDLIVRGVAAPATRLAVGTDGQVLTARTAAVLGADWETPATGADPLGPAGGDLAGTYPNPEVGGLLGIAIRAWSGSLSHPPTEAELEAILGSPANKAGLTFLVNDTGTGTDHYIVSSDGSGYFFAPLVRPTVAAGPPVLPLTTSPDGGWVWFVDPRAIQYNGYNYIGYIDGSGDIKIAIWHAGALSGTITVHAAYQVDDHATPALYIRPSDHRLIVYYSKHLGPAMNWRVSTTSLTTDPTLGDGFGTEVTSTLSEGAGDLYFTYPNPVYTNDADGVSGDLCWLFWRDHIGGTSAEWHYSSAADGVSFPGRSRLHQLTYSRVISDGVGRIDVVCSRHPNGGDGEPYKVCHLYRQSAAWHQSDGTVMGALPFTEADMTVIYDGTGASTPVWVWDIAYDGSGNPCVTFVVFFGGGWTDHRYYYGKWTGSAWSVHLIKASGDGSIAATNTPPDERGYSGGVVIDHANANIVYCSKLISGQWEIFKEVTADGGATWTETQLTFSSTGKQVRPVAVRAAVDLLAIWSSGRYDSYVDYALGMKGLGP